MAIPIFQQTIPAQFEKKLRCRIFVSYSHKDAKDAEQFMNFFKLQLCGIPQVGITEMEIFFDRGRILAGDDWDDLIHSALDEAQYFILLVSVHSLASKYCYHRELAKAVKRNLTIVLILLNHCPWDELPLPNDPRNRRLSALHTLPIDLRPIASWPGRGRDKAWTDLVKQLAARLLKDEPEPAPAIPGLGEKAIARVQTLKTKEPLLPYFCNQISVVNEFDRGVSGWKDRALVVLARGIHDDNLPRFWDRLQNKNLKDYLEANNAQVFRRRPLIWPFGVGDSLDAKERAKTMLGAISESLAGNRYRLNDLPALSSWLSTEEGVMILVTVLPAQPKKLIVSGLHSLLSLLEECPADTPLDRLVITILIEDDDLVSERNVIKASTIEGYQRTRLIDLMPLKPIAKNDIRVWHNAYEVESFHNITEEALLETVLRGNLNGTLRMRDFADKLKNLFQL